MREELFERERGSDPDFESLGSMCSGVLHGVHTAQRIRISCLDSEGDNAPIPAYSVYLMDAPARNGILSGCQCAKGTLPRASRRPSQDA
jgi:hypothetical protein